MKLTKQEWKYLERWMMSTATFLDPEPFKVSLSDLYAKIYCNSIKKGEK